MKNLLILLISLVVSFRSPAQSPPVITVPPTNQTLLAGAGARLTVTVAGTGP